MADVDFNEQLMTFHMGGEVAEFIKGAIGKEFDCRGVHRRPEDSLHIATEFWGYPNDNGLADSSGKRWWVYVYCDNPIVKGVSYQTSFTHFKGAVDRARMEREHQRADYYPTEEEWGKSKCGDCEHEVRFVRLANGTYLCSDGDGFGDSLFDNNNLPAHVGDNIPDEEIDYIIVKTRKVKK